MKRLITILFSTLLLSSLSAQTFYNDHFEATLNIDASTASFEVDGQQFKGEFLSKEMKSYPYSTVYCVGSEDGLRSLLFTTQFKLREGSDNNIKELYTVQLPPKKAIKSAMKIDKKLLSAGMKSNINQAIDNLKNNMKKKDVGKVKQAIMNLEKKSEEFIEKRMNSSLDEIIKGKKIEDIDNA